MNNPFGVFSFLFNDVVSSHEPKDIIINVPQSQFKYSPFVYSFQKKNNGIISRKNYLRSNPIPAPLQYGEYIFKNKGDFGGNLIIRVI